MRCLYNFLKYFKMVAFLCAFVISMTACAPMPIPEMQPIKYDQPIAVHLKKNAQLRWTEGEIVKTKESNAAAPYGVGVGAIVVNKLGEMSEERYADRLTYHFGSQQQTTFMTSLKDILNKQQVFQKVNFAPVGAESANDVLLTVHFKHSRVDELSHKITLIAALEIQSPGSKSFKRTFFIQNKDEKLNGKFDLLQQEIAQQLLIKILKGIESWQQTSLS